MGQGYLLVARVAIKMGEKAGVVFWVVLGFTVVLWQRARSEAA